MKGELKVFLQALTVATAFAVGASLSKCADDSIPVQDLSYAQIECIEMNNFLCYENLDTTNEKELEIEAEKCFALAQTKCR